MQQNIIPKNELEIEMYNFFGVLVDTERAHRFATWVLQRNEELKPQSIYDARMQQLRDLGLA